MPTGQTGLHYYYAQRSPEVQTIRLHRLKLLANNPSILLGTSPIIHSTRQSYYRTETMSRIVMAAY